MTSNLHNRNGGCIYPYSTLTLSSYRAVLTVALLSQHPTTKQLCPKDNSIAAGVDLFTCEVAKYKEACKWSRMLSTNTSAAKMPQIFSIFSDQVQALYHGASMNSWFCCLGSWFMAHPFFGPSPNSSGGLEEVQCGRFRPKYLVKCWQMTSYLECHGMMIWLRVVLAILFYIPFAKHSTM